MMHTFLNRYRALLRAKTPFIWIQTPVSQETLVALGTDQTAVNASWDRARGVRFSLCPVHHYSHTIDSLSDAFGHLGYCCDQTKQPYHLMLKQIDLHIDNPHIQSALFSALYPEDEDFHSTLIGLATTLRIPEEFKAIVSILKFPMPGAEEYRTHLEGLYADGIPECRDENVLFAAASGLWLTEFNQLISESIAHFGLIQPEFIRLRKKVIILQKRLMDNPPNADQIWKEFDEINDKISTGFLLS